MNATLKNPSVFLSAYVVGEDDALIFVDTNGKFDGFVVQTRDEPGPDDLEPYLVVEEEFHSYYSSAKQAAQARASQYGKTFTE